MEMIFGAPQYYVQGPGCMANLAYHMQQLGVGKHSFVIIDPGVLEIAKPLLQSLDEANLPYTVHVYTDSVKLDRIQALVDSIQEDYDCIIGVGGGKPVDVSKRVKWALGNKAKLIVVPTSIAADAATSRTSVAYGEREEIVEDKTIFNPDCVLVDSQVIVNAPARLFSAGMADALSKRYEYLLSLKCGQPNWYDGSAAFFIDNISRQMHDFLLKEGRYVQQCFIAHKLTPQVEHAITAMLLMSRMVWDPGGLHGAHDMWEEFHDNGYGHQYLHGDQVGFFDLVQLLLEDYPENEFEELYLLYRDLGVPLTISSLDFPIHDAKALDDLTANILKKLAKYNFHPTAEAFKKALFDLEERAKA